MIDTHCHLTDPRLHGQLEDVLKRASAAGVHRMITVGTGIADGRAAIELCRGRDHLRCTVGIHPNHVAEAQLEQVPLLRALQADLAVIALGEMGLDYHYDRAPRALQREFLQAQLQLASELGRPVVIHCREAVDDTLAILADFPDVPGVFHCFTGTAEEAERIVAGGYYLGFTGAVTFKKADGLRQAARQTPPQRILVETDAPYLSPEPMRKQKVNEPALVVHTAAVIADLKQMSLAEVDRITTANASALFGW